MRIYDNGVYRDMTPEEEAEYERQRAEAEERKRTDPTAEELLNELLGVSV